MVSFSVMHTDFLRIIHAISIIKKRQEKSYRNKLLKFTMEKFLISENGLSLLLSNEISFKASIVLTRLF